MDESWDGQERRKGVAERRKTQVSEKVANAFDAQTESRLNKLTADEQNALQEYLNKKWGSDARPELMNALKELFPVTLGKDGTATRFTPYFLMIRTGPTAQVGHVYALRQGTEGGHITKMFNWRGGWEDIQRKYEVSKTIKPAKIRLAGQDSKWTLIEKGVVD
jgi:hypothetical protein